MSRADLIAACDALAADARYAKKTRALARALSAWVEDVPPFSRTDEGGWLLQSGDPTVAALILQAAVGSDAAAPGSVYSIFDENSNELLTTYTDGSTVVRATTPDGGLFVRRPDNSLIDWLPEHTTEDEGRVLKIVAGVPTWVDA